MQAEQSVLDRIQRRQLKWYGHFLRIEDTRWPKMIYQWTPHARRRRGRSQQSRKNKMTDLLRSRMLEEDMAETSISGRDLRLIFCFLKDSQQHGDLPQFYAKENLCSTSLKLANLTIPQYVQMTDTYDDNLSVARTANVISPL